MPAAPLAVAVAVTVRRWPSMVRAAVSSAAPSTQAFRSVIVAERRVLVNVQVTVPAALGGTTNVPLVPVSGTGTPPQASVAS